MERRNFIKSGMAGMAALAMASTPIEALAAKSTGKRSANSTIKKPVPEEEFHLGMAGYSFVKFDLETTLKTMQTLDLHYLCIKDFHLPLTSNEEQIAAFHQKLASYGVKVYAVGPIYMKRLAGLCHTLNQRQINIFKGSNLIYRTIFSCKINFSCCLFTIFIIPPSLEKFTYRLNKLFIYKI